MGCVSGKQQQQQQRQQQQKHAAPVKPHDAASSNATLLTSLNTGGPTAAEKAESKSDVIQQAPEVALGESVHSGLGISVAPKQAADKQSVSSGGSVCLRRARTTTVQRPDLDVSVRQFLCRDTSALSVVGKHCKESRWRVQADGAESCLELALDVDQGVLLGATVSVKSNGAALFPAKAGAAPQSLREDFVHSWPYRGVLSRGLGVRGFFEVQPPAYRGTATWYPATVTAQREDGNFAVTALMPDAQGNNVHEVSYQAVKRQYLRVRETGEPLQVPERSLVLRVPQAQPLGATLRLDGEDITRHFARPTPPPGAAAGLALRLDAARQHLTADVGHSAVAWHVAGEPRRVQENRDSQRAVWVLQLGPLAEHTIVLERRPRSRLLALIVDGEPLVEASAADLGCEGPWHCEFRLKGESRLDFTMHETDRDCRTLPSMGTATLRSKVSHLCSVTVGNEQDLLDGAELTVDDLPFEELEELRPPHAEDPLDTTPEAFYHTYGVVVPYVASDEAPGTLAAELLGSLPEGAAGHWRSLLGACCGRPAIEAGPEAELTPDADARPGA